MKKIGFLVLGLLAMVVFTKCATNDHFGRSGYDQSVLLQVTAADADGDGTPDTHTITELPEDPDGTPTPNPTGTPTPGPTATPTANPTVTPTATPTKDPKPTPTPTATPTVNPTPTPTITPTVTPTTGPTSTPTPNPTGTPTPCPTGSGPDCEPTPGPEEICVDVVSTSIGVTSATVEINGVEIFGPNAYNGRSHNTPVIQSRRASLQVGTNALDVSYTLAGSPGDELKIQIYSCDVPPVLLYEKIFNRGTGRPSGGSDTFDLP